MRYYHFNCTTHNGEKVKIVVSAETKKKAINKLSDYRVSKGELHYYYLSDITDHGKELFYQNKNNALPLLIVLAGAKLGCEQIGLYGQNKNYLNCLTEETIALL